MSFLDQLEAQSLGFSLDDIFPHSLQLFRCIVPLAAYVSVEDVIVGQIYIEVVIVGHELFSSDSSVGDREKGQKLLLDILFGVPARMEILENTMVEVFH